MVEHQFSKLITRVRFPSPAPKNQAAQQQVEEKKLLLPGRLDADPGFAGRKSAEMRF